MLDYEKTKAELIEELNALRSRVTQLEQAGGRKKGEPSEESEQTFRMVFDNAPDGMLLADAESKKFIMGNASICQMLGYTRQEIVKLGVMDIHPAEDLPYVIDKFEKQARGEISLARNIPIKRKDASVFYADVSSSETRLSGRTYLMGIFRDVSDHKEAEDGLKQSEEMLQSIIDHSVDVFYIHDTEHKLTYVSPQSQEIFGYTPEEIMVKWTTLTTDNPINDEGFKLTERAIGTGERQAPYLLEIKRKDGELRIVEIDESPVKDDNGNVVAVTGGLRDVTERRQAEKALQESEQKYRTLVTNIPDITWTGDSEGNTTFVSSNIEKTSGYAPREICEQGDNLWLGRIHPDDLQRVKQAYIALFEKNVPFDVEYRVKRKDGRWIWLHDRSIATYEKDGVRYTDGIGSDITVRKVIEMALKESQANLAMAQQISHVGSWDWKIGTGEILWSDETYRQFGLEPGQIEPTFEFFMDAVHPEDRGFVKNALDRAMSEGQPYHMEFRIIRADGVERVLDNRGRVRRDERGKPLRMLGTAQDITGRKRSEQRQALRFDILETFHKHGSLKEICARMISLIKAHLNCEAVALRMKEGDDYPYFVNDGFEPEFIESENYLCSHDETGGCMRDSGGKPVLACMCGLVIKGRFDEDDAFFTSKGSFWTNSTTSLLASTTAESRGAVTRNTCNRHGYESVALIRVESDGDTIGLLQVNAKRNNLFSKSRLQFLEELGQLIGMAVDRKRVEQELSHERELLQTLLDNIPDYIYFKDRSRKFVRASDSFCDLFACPMENIIGKTDGELFPRAVAESSATDERHIMETGVPIIGKEESGTIGEEEHWVSTTKLPWRNAKDHIVGLFGISRDITLRKRAEMELRKSEEEYRTLVESAGESIASIDENGVFLFMNTTGAKRLGGKPEDYVGKTMWDLFPGAHADRQMASIHKVMEEGYGMTFTSLTELKGGLRWHNTTIEPLRAGGSGRTTGVMVIARDIHDLRLAEEELARYREKMAQAERLASLGTLSATVAHELTQPLTVIRLSLDNLLDDLKAASSSGTFTRKLEKSLAEVSNLTAIIDRFRNFARKSSETTIGAVNLQAVAERIVILLNASARRARVELHLKDMDRLPLVQGNERDMEQLFFALIQNAIQAADGKEARELVVSAVVKDQRVELRFADTCGGIAPENIDAVLEPFFTTKPPGQGTGLGLCIVQEIAFRAGGKVNVESEFGKGATFFVTLPVTHDQMQ